MKQKLLVLIFLLSTFGLSAQTMFPAFNPSYKYPTKEADTTTADAVFENLLAKWDNNVAELQKQVNPTDKDFKLFTNFYQTFIDSTHFELMNLINSGKINGSNIAPYIVAKKQKLQALYASFLSIKKEFPSSIDNAMGNALPPADVAP